MQPYFVVATYFNARVREIERASIKRRQDRATLVHPHCVGL